jgi:hypothetical protein
MICRAWRWLWARVPVPEGLRDEPLEAGAPVDPEGPGTGGRPEVGGHGQPSGGAPVGRRLGMDHPRDDDAGAIVED